MPDNAITKNLQNATILLEDGDSPVSSLTIPVDEGDLEFTVRPREAIPIYNRGVLTSFTEGSQNALTWSFSMKFREWGSRTSTGAPISPVEFMTQTGAGSALVSTTLCGPFTFDMTYVVTVNCVGADDQDEDISIPDSKVDELQFSEGAEYSRIRASGKSLAASGFPTSTRT